MPRSEVGESTDYQQDPKFMGEVFTHPGFTKQQLNSDRRQRAANYAKRKGAEDRQKAAKRLHTIRSKRMRETHVNTDNDKTKEELRPPFFDTRTHTPTHTPTHIHGACPSFVCTYVCAYYSA